MTASRDIPGLAPDSAARRGPAYRIETERLAVRCWQPADARRLKEAVDSSIEHLRRWLPWAYDEPQTVPEKVALLRRFRGQFDLDDDYVYGILDRAERRVLGGTGLHTRGGAEAREIGYWIRADAEGQGYVTEAVAALTRVGFEVDRLERIEIRCDPANGRSSAVARRLGYAHEATLRGRIHDGQGRPTDVMVFSLFADGYPSSPAASRPLAACDASGARLI
jgi:RimJ/RimL family protein N-acetyltransferase